MPAGLSNSSSVGLDWSPQSAPQSDCRQAGDDLTQQIPETWSIGAATPLRQCAKLRLRPGHQSGFMKTKGGSNVLSQRRLHLSELPDRCPYNLDLCFLVLASYHRRCRSVSAQ